MMLGLNRCTGARGPANRIPLVSKNSPGARAQFQSIAMQFLALGLAIVQGFLLTPMSLRHIDYKLFGAWLATGQMLSWVSLLDPGVNEVLRQRVAHAFGGASKDVLGVILGSGAHRRFPDCGDSDHGWIRGCVRGSSLHFRLTRMQSSAAAKSAFWQLRAPQGLTIASFAPGSALQGLQRHILHGTISLLGAASYFISAIVLLVRRMGLGGHSRSSADSRRHMDCRLDLAIVLDREARARCLSLHRPQRRQNDARNIHGDRPLEHWQ